MLQYIQNEIYTYSPLHTQKKSDKYQSQVENFKFRNCINYKLLNYFNYRLIE